MSKIEKLTAAQEARIVEIRDKWLSIGLWAGRDFDTDKCYEAIDRAYVAGGLSVPGLRLHLGSPMAGAIASTILAQVWDQVGDQVWAQVGDQVGAQVWDQVGDQVRAQVWAQVGDQVGAQVGDQVRAQVWAQVRAQVWAQVGAQVGDQVRAQVWDQVGAQVGDQVGAQVGAQVRAQVWDQVRAQVGDQVGAQVWAQVRAQVGDQVWAQVGAQVGAQVRAQVWDQVWAQVGAQVGDQVWAQVWAQVGDQVGAQVRAQVGEAGYGSHDANWLGFYDFFGEACGVNIQQLRPLIDISHCCGWWWPFRGGVIITPRPIRIFRNAEHHLHCDGSLALEYPDGWGIWALNGVRVPREIAETPARDLHASVMLHEQNAEVRREIVRKIGIDKVIADLGGETLEQCGDYELLNLNLGDGRKRPYLKMRNPSIGVWHVEGVSPECVTVEQALAFRNGTKEAPVILT